MILIAMYGAHRTRWNRAIHFQNQTYIFFLRIHESLHEVEILNPDLE